MALCSSERCSSAVDGSLKLPASRGMVVLPCCVASARVVTAMASSGSGSGRSGRGGGATRCSSPASESKVRSMPLRPCEFCGSGDGAVAVAAAACMGTNSSAAAGARFGTSCAVTTGFALAAAARFFSRSFAAFLAGALHAPVGKAVERGVHKSEARLRPDPHRAERECRREIQAPRQ